MCCYCMTMTKTRTMIIADEDGVEDESEGSV